MTIIVMIINLIYIAQFDTSGILPAWYLVIMYLQMQICAHNMNIHETIIFIHICMSTHKHTDQCKTWLARCQYAVTGRVSS